MKCILFLCLILLSCESYEKPEEEIFIPITVKKFKVSYDEKMETFRRHSFTGLGGDVLSKTDGTPDVLQTGLNESHVEITVDDSLNYYIETDYTNGNPNFAFPKNSFEDESANAFNRQLPGDVITKEIDNNGVVTSYYADGHTESYDFTHDEDFKLWRNQGLTDAVARVSSIVYTVKNKPLKKQSKNKLQRLLKSNTNISYLANERVAISHKLNEDYSYRKLYSLKSGLLLSESMYSKQGIESKQLYRYETKGDISVINARIDQSFSFSSEHNEMVIDEETQVLRTNIKIEE